jgi:hypothetical protein
MKNRGTTAESGDWENWRLGELETGRIGERGQGERAFLESVEGQSFL